MPSKSSKSFRNSKKTRSSSNPNAIASRLASLERRFRNDVAVNPKWINTPAGQITSTSVTVTNPSVNCISGVAPGTSENTRIGAKIKLKRLIFSYEIYNTSTAQQNPLPTAYRVYLIRELTSLGSAAQPAQFLLDTNPTPSSQRDRTNRNANRFHVLYDSGPKLLGNASSALASPFASFSLPNDHVHEVSLSLGDVIADYSRGTAGTVADIDTNAITCIVVTDNSTATVVTFLASWSLEFLDA